MRKSLERFAGRAFDMEARLPDRSVTIAFQTPAIERNVQGIKQIVVPFVGTTGSIVRTSSFTRETRVNTTLSRLGAGIVIPDDHDRVLLYGLISPRSVVQSLRALSLIQHLRDVNLDSLAAVYALARRISPGEKDAGVKIDPRHFEVLEEYMSPKSTVQDLQHQALAQPIPREVVDCTLLALQASNIGGINIDELRTEVNERKVELSPVVEAILEAGIIAFPAGHTAHPREDIPERKAS